MPSDVVRGQLRCTTLKQMCAVVEAVQSESTAGDVRVNRVKNKFIDNPKGWADLTFSLFFESCPVVVAELQVVHAKMMLVREEMNAHDGYEAGRFAAELRNKRPDKKTTAALPYRCGTESAEEDEVSVLRRELGEKDRELGEKDRELVLLRRELAVVKEHLGVVIPISLALCRRRTFSHG